MAQNPPEHVLAEVNALLKEELRPVGSAQGKGHVVYQLVSSGGRRVGLRIPLQPYEDDWEARLCRKGYEILATIKAATPHLLAPAVLSLASNEFLVLEFLEGTPMRSWSLAPSDMRLRREFLDDLASFYFDLWTTPLPPEKCQDDWNLGTVLPPFTKPSTGPPLIYGDWLRGETDAAFIRAIRAKNGAWGDPIYMLHRRSIIGSLTCHPQDSVLVPYLDDIHADNVILKGHRLSGVVDWDTASIALAGSSIHHAHFISNLPGFLTEHHGPDELAAQDRCYVEEAIERLHSGSSKARDIRLLLATSQERQFFELSIKSKEINSAYIELKFPRGLEVVGGTKARLQRELEDWAIRNPKDAKDPGVAEFRKRLWP